METSARRKNWRPMGRMGSRLKEAYLSRVLLNSDAEWRSRGNSKESRGGRMCRFELFVFVSTNSTMLQLRYNSAVCFGFALKIFDQELRRSIRGPASDFFLSLSFFYSHSHSFFSSLSSLYSHLQHVDSSGAYGSSDCRRGGARRPVCPPLDRRDEAEEVFG